MLWAIINAMLSSLHIEFPKDLPVSTKRDAIMAVLAVLAALAAHQVTIVCGKTGSGKITQLPKIALAMGRGLCNSEVKFIGFGTPLSLLPSRFCLAPRYISSLPSLRSRAMKNGGPAQQRSKRSRPAQPRA